jgi:hypothetical protein
VQLVLDDSGLTGSISPEIGKLSFLTLLVMRGCAGVNCTTPNDIVSTIPSEIGLLAVLLRLDLSYNSLSGTYPTELSLLSHLTQMRLLANKFAGPMREIDAPFELAEGCVLQFDGCPSLLASPNCDNLTSFCFCTQLVDGVVTGCANMTTSFMHVDSTGAGGLPTSLMPAVTLGGIVGIAVGAVLIIICTLVLVVFLWRVRLQEAKKSNRSQKVLVVVDDDTVHAPPSWLGVEWDMQFKFDADDEPLYARTSTALDLNDECT